MSEGTLTVRDYLGHYPHDGADALVLLSPLIRPARIYLPPRDSSGWGVATAWELRGMIGLEHLAGGPRDSIDEPFVRSIFEHAPEYRKQMMCLVPGVRTIAFLPFASAVVTPPGPLSDVPVVEVPGLHGEIASQPRVSGDVLWFVRGGQVPLHRMIGYQLARDAAMAWDTPALALSLVPPGITRPPSRTPPSAGPSAPRVACTAPPGSPPAPRQHWARQANATLALFSRA